MSKEELSLTYKFSKFPYVCNLDRQINRENIGGIWNNDMCILPLEIWEEITFIK